MVFFNDANFTDVTLCTCAKIANLIFAEFQFCDASAEKAAKEGGVTQQMQPGDASCHQLLLSVADVNSCQSERRK